MIRHLLMPAVVAVLLVTSACSAGGGDAGGDAATSGAAITLTDARGETVELVEAPERVHVTRYRQVLDELLMLDARPADTAQQQPPTREVQCLVLDSRARHQM
jgi:ABC-type Fe3+-hydroxamate transport system substrate-binding protein